VPAIECGSFDLVLNCGTSGHVLNQYNVFNVMHDAVRVGGVIHHAIPMTGNPERCYFKYTPRLLSDMARANQYEIVTLDPSDPIALRDVRAPDSFLSVTWRRTSPARFRAPLEANTAAAPVAKKIRDAYGLHDAGAPDRETGQATKAEREAMDRSIRSMVDRYTDPGLDYPEILRLYRTYSELYAAYGATYVGATFPPLLEKKAIELALAAYPDRDDLRVRLEKVEKSLAEQWPLYRFSEGALSLDGDIIAMDGIEEKLLSIPGKQMRLRYAVVAFRRYLAAGHPERFPLALEFAALRYAAEELYPDDWSLRLRLGYCAVRLCNDMTLRRRAD
jgi:hypothetical protein